MTAFDPTAAAATDETEWLAVRYVLGELPAGDAEAFEERLGEDQSARDAVVQAVQIVQTLAVVPLPAVPVRPSKKRTLVATLATLAALLLVGVVAWQARDVTGDRAPRFVADDVDPARLVVLWSDSAQSLGGVAEPESEDSVPAEDETALLPPDWMLAAVEHEALLDAVDPSLDPDSDMIERN